MEPYLYVAFRVHGIVFIILCLQLFGVHLEIKARLIKQTAKRPEVITSVWTHKVLKQILYIFNTAKTTLWCTFGGYTRLRVW